MVWLTFVLGRQLDDEVTGASAAVLLACSPIFLYQSVQPMSDVPAAALWLGALTAASRAPATAGVLMSLAILTRVNLAPLALLLVIVLPHRRAWLRFGLAALPGLVVMVALNVARYGGALASGYGSTEVLFSLAHVRPNLARYPAWLIGTETPFLLLALLAPAWIARHRDRARLAMAALSSAVSDPGHLSSLHGVRRLVVHPVPAARAARGDRVRGGGRRSTRRPRVRTIAAVVICLVFVPWRVHVARDRQVLDLQALESRFLLTGAAARRRCLPGRWCSSMQQSGSIRYHGGRPTLAWDAIAAGGARPDHRAAAQPGLRSVPGPRRARGGAVSRPVQGPAVRRARLAAVCRPPCAGSRAGLRSAAREKVVQEARPYFSNC